MLQLIEVAIKVASGCKRFILIRARTLIPSGLGVEGCVETEKSPRSKHCRERWVGHGEKKKLK